LLAGKSFLVKKGREVMAAEAQLIVERATLHWLAEHHPDRTQRELAAYLHRSVDWMNKWLKRLHEADPHDVTVLHSRSRASISPPPSGTTPLGGR
jgi:hypothetical protein